MKKTAIVSAMFAVLSGVLSCQKENVKTDSSAYEMNVPVQLWTDGPFWAPTNLTAGKEADYGRFFPWGYNTGCYHTYFMSSSWFDDENYYVFSGENVDDDIRRGFADYRTHAFENQAGYFWSGEWRLPTRAEFQALLDNCTTEYIKKGRKGVKFTGKGDFADKFIFLPAAGYGEEGGWKDENESGHYWSCTEQSSEKAWCLNLSDNEAAIGKQPKYMGFSIRPVRDAKAMVSSEDLLSGLFSVSKFFKTVKFSKGNLYFTGDSFRFEENQYEYSSSWDVTHVSHFYSSSEASMASAAIFNDSGSPKDFVFFTNASSVTPHSEFIVNDTQGCFRTLRRDEWDYILNYRENASQLHKSGVTVCGQENCLILAPDDFSGTIQESYEEAEWQTAEAAGLVCLPPAGLRTGRNILKPGEIGLYKSSSVSNTRSPGVYSLYFRPDYTAAMKFDFYDNGGAVRLVVDN